MTAFKKRKTSQSVTAPHPPPSPEPWKGGQLSARTPARLTGPLTTWDVGRGRTPSSAHALDCGLACLGTPCNKIPDLRSPRREGLPARGRRARGGCVSRQKASWGTLAALPVAMLEDRWPSQARPEPGCPLETPRSSGTQLPGTCHGAHPPTPPGSSPTTARLQHLCPFAGSDWQDSATVWGRRRPAGPCLWTQQDGLPSPLGLSLGRVRPHRSSPW